MKKILLLSLMIGPSIGFAYHGRHCDEPILYRKYISSENHFTGTCAESVPLKLVSGDYNFAFGVARAHFWEGSYIRPAVNVSKISYKWYTCHGALIDQEVKTIKSEFNVSFDLENKNLSDKSTWADVKAPMTDEEARLALEAAFTQCQKAKTP